MESPATYLQNWWSSVKYLTLQTFNFETLKTHLLLLSLLFPVFVFSGIQHKPSSVLATGRWYKIAVTQTGLYQVTYQDILTLGMDPALINPQHFRLYGNGGGMLPESNADFRIDDLRENTIQVFDGGDAHFDPGDYFIFYGEAPDKWYFDTVSRTFFHQKNLFSDSTYYFLTADLGPGKRPLDQASTDSASTYTSRRMSERVYHDVDLVSLIRSGRVWYGEAFNKDKTTFEFSFPMPDADSTSPVIVRTDVAARSEPISRFILTHNGKVVDSIQVDGTDPDNTYYYGKSKLKKTQFAKLKPDFTLGFRYNLPVESSLGWLNYFEVNCIRRLIYHGPQMFFRDISSAFRNRVTEFQLKNPTPTVKVWDITDPGNILNIQGTFTDTTFRFRLPTDSLREFVAFDGSFFHPVYLSGPVANQNLHASEPSQMLIVSHPLFLSLANELADFHRVQSAISVSVVTTNQIFNEFASGQQDITAIRDYVKMLFDRGQPANAPRFLLIFGDGSYDPKNRVPGNNNMVPTYQSQESLKFVGTYVTDDYFGIMGEELGVDSNGKIDIGIGRFPVTTTTEARQMLDKIFHYSSTRDSVLSDWRNVVTFVADDENDNLHLEQAEELSRIVANNYPLFNVNKIYFDAYPIVLIPGGARFPDATKAINHAVSKGSLIINYTGHGGEDGWSNEKALTVGDINSWRNFSKLPVFLTATCEFSRFDNPERLSAGEIVILHPNGGAIALYSTTRLALSTSNFRLDTSFFHHLMDKLDGNYLSMGDLIRISKNNNGNNINIRNFVLLGDPAQKIAFPEYKVKTLTINNKPLDEADTLLGLSTVTVTGIIENEQGQIVQTFDGQLDAKVFDKPVTYTTLGNTIDAHPANFTMQNSLLHAGSSLVQQGEFNFSFVLPKDIALQFGHGKLSYYAQNGSTDAAGFTDRIIIGGRDPDIDPVNNGPEISLYMNDRSFSDGGKTSFSPLLIADLSDTNGINYLGLGIGHEIMAVLDGDWVHAIVLNDYYHPDFGSSARGSLTYAFSDLSIGKHSLLVKAWDLYDNSSEKTITFHVSSSISVSGIMNFPNPMTDHTSFRFYPMKGTGPLTVEIDIYNLQGQMVQSLTYLYGENQEEPLMYYWDGTNRNGMKLNSGIYPYKIKFRGNNGIYGEASQKLVIIR